MITLWPSLRNLTAVSTIRESIDIRGSRVFSSTMELVPITYISIYSYSGLPRGIRLTQLYDNSQLFLPLLTLRHLRSLFVV